MVQISFAATQTEDLNWVPAPAVVGIWGELKVNKKELTDTEFTHIWQQTKAD